MNVNWGLLEKICYVVTLLGFVITAIKVIRSFIRQKKLKCLKGQWYEYHWTNPEAPEKPSKFSWLESTLEAKPWFFKSSYKLRYVNKGLVYKGSAHYIDKEGDIVFRVQYKKMFAKLDNEILYFRYNAPENSSPDNPKAGIWLSSNFDKKIAGGASILLRNQISLDKPEEELNSMFKENFEFNHAAILVKNDSTGFLTPQKKVNIFKRFFTKS